MPPNPKNESAWEFAKYIRLFQDALEAYEKEHPHWRAEVLVSLIGRGLLGLKQHIDDAAKPDITWNNPFVELHYPVDWNWETKRDGDVVSNQIVSGKFTRENTADLETTRKTINEMMVRHLNLLLLQDLTGCVWLEQYEANGNLTPILPANICEELNAIKSDRRRNEALEELVHPFSIGATLIDFDDKKLKNGAPVPKRILKQLANIDKLMDFPPIRFCGDINGQKLEMSLVFQIHPLAIEYERKRAYHSITVGLFAAPTIIGGEIVTTTPARWSNQDQDTLWHELFQELAKLADLFIPKPESQTSAILSVNANIEMPVGSLNEAQKRVADFFCQVGNIKDLNMKANEVGDAGAVLPKAGPNVQQSRDHTSIGNNPWKSGSFYLLVFVVLVVLPAVLATFLPIWSVVIVELCGLLAVILVGAFQLRNDDKIGEKSLLALVRLVCQKMPLIGKLLHKGPK